MEPEVRMEKPLSGMKPETLERRNRGCQEGRVLWHAIGGSDISCLPKANHKPPAPYRIIQSTIRLQTFPGSTQRVGLSVHLHIRPEHLSVQAGHTGLNMSAISIYFKQSAFTTAQTAPWELAHRSQHCQRNEFGDCYNNGALTSSYFRNSEKLHS